MNELTTSQATITLHYKFRDNSMHYIDAWTQNSCEREFLSIYKHLLIALNIDDMKVYAIPRKEGSFLSGFYLFCNDPIVQQVIAMLIFEMIKYGLKEFESKDFIDRINNLICKLKTTSKYAKINVEEIIDDILSAKHNLHKKIKRMHNIVTKSQANDENPIQEIDITFSEGENQFSSKITGDLNDIKAVNQDYPNITNGN